MSIALIGNPNCGKSTLFNTLTGSCQRVSNWPGVTVERKVGIFDLAGQKVELVDLPGTYSIENYDGSISQDEWIARDFILNGESDLIINIIDATNLQRGLYLTLQLIDINRPMIVVLNMIDALAEMNEVINVKALSMMLGCPVVAISASRKIGFDKLKKILADNLLVPSLPSPQIDTLNAETTKIINTHLACLDNGNTLSKLNRYSLLNAMLTEANLCEKEQAVVNACRQDLVRHYDSDIDIAIACSRYDAIEWIIHYVLEKPREASKNLTDKLDRFALGRITGIPVFLFSMYAIFLVSINFGSVFIDFFDIFFGTIFVDGLDHLLTQVGAPNWLIIILANGIGNGIKTVASFIPVIGAMFFCLSFLEDSGYLARAAMVIDRGMRAIGLPGKAFVPMLVGFGCTVPAIMGTRTLESTRDRLMSICMVHFMSCGARLPVYALFAVIFFPSSASTIVFILYLLGLVVAVVTGIILKYTLLPGKITPFIMELPVYRIPTLFSLFYLTWIRLKSFVYRAGKAIILMVAILSILNSVNIHGSLEREASENSVLAVVSQKLTPVFEPMGANKENWQAIVGIFTGIFAKEVVIGTLNSLYSAEDKGDGDAAFDFMEGIKSAFLTIPENLSDLLGNFFDPFGFSTINNDIGNLEDELSIADSAVTKIETSFGSKAAVMAYLIFILLYTPCVSALGAVYREAGLRWTLFVGSWTFLVAWLFASAYYQYTQLDISPNALSWLIGFMVSFIFIIVIMKCVGKGGYMGELTVSKSTNYSKGCC